jgi:hypothetical protein
MACPPEPVEVFYFMAHFTITILANDGTQIESFVNTENEIYFGQVDSETNWFAISIQEWEELSSFINLEINKIK